MSVGCPRCGATQHFDQKFGIWDVLSRHRTQTASVGRRKTAIEALRDGVLPTPILNRYNRGNPREKLVASSLGGRSSCLGFAPAAVIAGRAAFQTATIIYDATYWFCEKFLNARTRTVDQMIQAGRSGRQNIAEGSRAAATSSQTELRLLNVARSSLEELLLDFEDYLRHRHLAQWAPHSPEAMAVRQVPGEVPSRSVGSD